MIVTANVFVYVAICGYMWLWEIPLFSTLMRNPNGQELDCWQFAHYCELNNVAGGGLFRIHSLERTVKAPEKWWLGNDPFLFVKACFQGLC